MRPLPRLRSAEPDLSREAHTSLVQQGFLASPAPLAIAHRGGADEAPENTLPAFARAYELGYRYFETDVHLTRDGVLVAFHDDRLDRVTDHAGLIRDLDLAAIRQADAGWHFTADGGRTHPFRGRGIEVPTLEDILIGWPNVFVNIDMKADETVEPLVRVIAEHDAWDRLCVGSFSDARLRRFRVLTGGRAATSMGPAAVTIARATSLIGRMPRLSAECLQVPVRDHGIPIVDRRLVRSAHRSGLHVHVWTVSDEPTMRWLLDLEVDGIMTDRPRLLRDVLDRRGLWHGGPDLTVPGSRPAPAPPRPSRRRRGKLAEAPHPAGAQPPHLRPRRHGPDYPQRIEP